MGKRPPLQGTADRVGPDATEGSVSPQASVRMHDAPERAGVATELHLHAGQQHVFDAQPAFGRQCAAIMKLFLDRYVAAAEAVAAS